MLQVIGCNRGYHTFGHQTQVVLGPLDRGSTHEKFEIHNCGRGIQRDPWHWNCSCCGLANAKLYQGDGAWALYNWTGFYVGGNFGYSWGRANSVIASTPAGTTSTNSQDLNGAVGGGQIGFNWQTNNFVWGLEADFQGTDQRNSFFNIDRNLADVNAATGTAVPGQAIVSSFDQRLKWLGTVRGRLVSCRILVGWSMPPAALPMGEWSPA